MNRAMIAGYVGKDPTVKDTRVGLVANFSVATTTRLKGSKEKTEWHQVVAFGNTAQAIAEYIRKGSWVLVEGRIQYGQYQDKESGQTRYTTDIVADRVHFGPRTNSYSSTTTTTSGDEDDGGMGYPPEDDLP